MRNPAMGRPAGAGASGRGIDVAYRDEDVPGWMMPPIRGSDRQKQKSRIGANEANRRRIQMVSSQDFRRNEPPSCGDERTQFRGQLEGGRPGSPMLDSSSPRPRAAHFG